MSEEHDFELELLARLAAEELQRQGPDHPSAERLAAYHAGKLPDRESEELQNHLAVCRDCTQDLLALPFREDAEKRARVLIGRDRQTGRRPLVVLPAWVPAALASWVPGGTADQRISDVGSLPGTPDRRRPRVPAQVMVYVMAAGLVGSFTGFSFGYVSHHEKPQAIVVVPIGSEVTRGETDPVELAPAGPAGSAPTLVWQLREGADPKAMYRVEIQDRAGTTLLTAETGPTALAAPPHPGSKGAGPLRSVSVEIPLEQLAPGEYRLFLTGSPGEEPVERPLKVLARTKV